jgi:DNA topoisomerase-6 subunit B
VGHREAEALYNAIQEVKLTAPPTDCLVPIGSKALLAGLLKGMKAEFYTASTRPPAVYRGNPFQIEVGLAFGGELPAQETARVIRFANRVPLLYQQAECCSFKAVLDASWKNYGLSQPRGSLPLGPLVVMIHMASVWVPFTSESKEAIADYDEIRKEMKLALQECGRKLGIYLRRRKRMQRESERRTIFERYIGEVAKSCEKITGTDAKKLYEALLRQAERRTAQADQQLDDEGRVLNETARLARDEQVVIVPAQQPDLTNGDDDIGESLFEDRPKPKPRKTTKRSKKKTRKKTRTSKRK